jgi:hypothetical protein
LQLPQSYTIASTSTASSTAATTSGFPNTSNYNNNNISHEHVNILPSTSQQQQQNFIRLPHPLQQHLQQQPNSSIGGNEGIQNQQHFGNFLPAHLLHHPQPPLTMQVPGASNEIQNNVANNSTPPDLASIQQYVMLMNQQQQQQQHQQHAAAVALQNQQQQQQQNAGQNSLAANALLFSALNRSNDPNFAALSALQSPSVDLSQAAFVLNNERRPSTHFLPPPSAPPTGQGPSSHPQLTPVHQTPPMLSPLLQAAVQQQQHHQQQQQQLQQQHHHHPSISQQSLEELAALSQLNPNLIQANLLSELQREVQRQQQAAAAAAAAHQQAQQFQHLQAALQQANVPPGHAQQLLSVLQQQHQQQQQHQHQQQQLLAQQSLASGLFTPGGGLRPQMKPPLAPPQASPLLKQAATVNSSPINGMRFMDEPSTSSKKMSQPQLPSIPMHSGGGASSSLPKRASFSSQPSTAQASTSSRKTSAAAIQNLPKPIPTPISKAPPPLSLPSTSSISSSSSSSQQQQPGPSTYLSQQQQQQQLPTPPGLPQQPYYPTHFLRGTSIRLENGETRLIEDMKAEDFYKSSQLTSEMRVCIGEISEIKQTQCCRFVNLSYKMDIDGQPAIGTMTASAEYPFHEIESGWTSYDPFKTLNLYGLKCKKLEIGDKCVLLSKDFVDKDDTELKKKWQKQFKGQFKGYAKSQSLAGNEDIKDQPMEIQRSSNHGQNRLVRKSIPPPLAMNSTTGFPFIHQSNGPTTSHHSSTSESITPLTSTISAPADTYISNHAFSLSLPSNEPFSAPAAMDDLTVDAQMAHEAYVKQQQQQQHQSDMMGSGSSEAMQIDDEDPSPASSSSTLKQQPSTSQQQSQQHQQQQSQHQHQQQQQLPPQDDVFLDFSI